jgi:hypothetical protein
MLAERVRQWERTQLHRSSTRETDAWTGVSYSGKFNAKED